MMKMVLKIVCISLILSSFIIHAGKRDAFTDASSEINIVSYLQLDKTDLVKIIYRPLGSDDNQQIVRAFSKPEVIADLLNELREIPARGSGRRIKFFSRDPEYYIEFISQNKLLGTLRIKSSYLDAPLEPSWDFYDGKVDRKFVELVIRLCQ